jgi:hypothetical protein
MFYYGVDLLQTIAGSGVAPFVVMAYINRLPDTSKFSASLMGDDTWFGWGQDRIIQADIYDNISRLTEVQLRKGGVKNAKLERFPRPKPKSAKKPKSRLAELYGMFRGGSGAKK